MNSKKMNRFLKSHFIDHLFYNNGPRVNVEFMGGEAKIKPPWLSELIFKCSHVLSNN